MTCNTRDAYVWISQRRQRRQDFVGRRTTSYEVRLRGARAGMGRLFTEVLEGRIYRCRRCRTHLAACAQLVSKAFHCRNGKAFLFNTAVNCQRGCAEERLMTTGLHTVADLSCVSCSVIVGWTYLEAQEKSQKYKEGKARGAVYAALREFSGGVTPLTPSRPHSSSWRSASACGKRRLGRR